jgi:chromosome segregation ATPase
MSNFPTADEYEVTVYRLERELAQAKSVIAEQKETIERLQSEIDIEEKRFNQLADDYSEQAALISEQKEYLKAYKEAVKEQDVVMRDNYIEQAALIETLAKAIALLRVKTDPKYGVPIANKALAAYREWKK